jgi:hypothetical protein
MQYSKSLDAHRIQLEQYLVREGTDKDGSRAKLYGTDLEEYKDHMVDKNFRIFLSPQSDRVDLKAMTEKFVKKLEMQTGYKLYWQAANHYNTAHPHAHLLINGVDKNGREVNFSRDVVKTFMRETARDIVTSQIGIRTKEQIGLEKEQELSASRYTRLDDKLKEHSGGVSGVILPRTGKDRERMIVRLETLRKLKLCIYKDGAYKLSPNWEESLRANGRYNAYLKARDDLPYSFQSNLRVYSGEHGRVAGRVTKIYRTDGDASDNHAVVLEGLDGRAYFVPLFKQPEVKDGGKKTALKEGDIISLHTYETQRGRLTPVMTKMTAVEAQRELKGRSWAYER